MTKEVPAVIYVGARANKPSDIPGSVKVLCARCGRTTWLAPAGQKRREKKPGPVICIGCFEQEVKQGEQVIITEEVVREFKAAGFSSEDVAHALAAAKKRYGVNIILEEADAKDRGDH